MEDNNIIASIEHIIVNQKYIISIVVFFISSICCWLALNKCNRLFWKCIDLVWISVAGLGVGIVASAIGSDAGQKNLSMGFDQNQYIEQNNEIQRTSNLWINEHCGGPLGRYPELTDDEFYPIEQFCQSVFNIRASSIDNMLWFTSKSYIQWDASLSTINEVDTDKLLDVPYPIHPEELTGYNQLIGKIRHLNQLISFNRFTAERINNGLRVEISYDFFVFRFGALLQSVAFLLLSGIVPFRLAKSIHDVRQERQRSY